MSKDANKQPEFITLESAAEMTTGTRITFVPGVQAMYAEAVSYTHLTLPTILLV